LLGGNGSVFENVRIDTFDKGMSLHDDHLLLTKPRLAYCRCGIDFVTSAADNTVVQPHFYHNREVDVSVNCGTYGLQAYILNPCHEADPSAPVSYHYQIDNTNSQTKPSNRIVCVVNPDYNVAERLNITPRSLPYVRFSGRRQGFAMATPNLPAGTGPANSTTNSNPFPVRIYQQSSANPLGAHLVDPEGTDFALPTDPAELTLDPGAKIYYTNSVPASWKWYGT